MGIREMQVAEIKTIQKVANLSYETTYRNILPRAVQQDFLNLAYGTERLMQRMNSSVFLVFFHEDIIKGFANFSKVNRKGNSELLAIYLEEKYQRQKIGTSFINYAKEHFEGLKTITINLEAENNSAIQFAENLGFVCKEQFIENFQGVYLHMKRFKLYI